MSTNALRGFVRGLTSLYSKKAAGENEIGQQREDTVEKRHKSNVIISVMGIRLMSGNIAVALA